MNIYEVQDQYDFYVKWNWLQQQKKHMKVFDYIVVLVPGEVSLSSLFPFCSISALPSLS